jgi:virginiamycin B lyase
LTAFELAEGSGPFGVTAGADGALWFTAMTSGDIGRISVDGELSGWPSVGGAPSMIVTGPDNALWFTLNQGNAVGRLAPAEGITVRELPTAGAGPVGIAATHDDALWFTEILADKLGRIPMDEPIQEMELPGKPHGVVADPDDGVWVSLWGANQIARVSDDGAGSRHDRPAAGQRAAWPGDRPRWRTVGRAGVGVRAANAHLTWRNRDDELGLVTLG